MSGDKKWSVARSTEIYNIHGWGVPYFSINAEGNVQVSCGDGEGKGVDLFELVQDLKNKGLALPLILRFPQILRHRLQVINECFAAAIKEYAPEARYRGVFPIKVNQERHIVEDIVKFGKTWSLGLEVGSKPELLIALATLTGPNDLILCNGFKDQNYIETALLAQKLGNTVIIILERMEELHIAIRAAKATGIKPVLGIRAKLSTRGTGLWSTSIGDRAKFGLNASQILSAIKTLKEHDMLSSLQLLHFHMGSQISSIIPLKHALREASAMYAQLGKLGANMLYFDVGGGLAIDYDGSKTDGRASRNYTTQGYAYDVVMAIQEACESAKLPLPTIISESGRAIVSHHSILVFEVLDSNDFGVCEPSEPSPDAHYIVKVMFDTYQLIRGDTLLECFNDVTQAKKELESAFRLGYISLQDRAEAEQIFWSCGQKIRKYLRHKNHPHELTKLEKALSSIYFCNFSTFRSAPDVNLVKGVFPVMPIHRLDEEPTQRAQLADITCDSMGVLKSFISSQGQEKAVLDVHDFHPGKPYYMGMFLGGAYQEILGSLHNLFGDTTAVHIIQNPNEPSEYVISDIVKGDSTSDVLRYVHYVPEAMVESVLEQTRAAVESGLMTSQQNSQLLQHYTTGLSEYSYLHP